MSESSGNSVLALERIPQRWVPFWRKNCLYIMMNYRWWWWRYQRKVPIRNGRVRSPDRACSSYSASKEIDWRPVAGFGNCVGRSWYRSIEPPSISNHCRLFGSSVSLTVPNRGWWHGGRRLQFLARTAINMARLSSLHATMNLQEVMLAVDPAPDYDGEDHSSSEYNMEEEQRSYMGTRKVIPSALADALCTDLGVRRVLMKLNTTLGTLYRLDSVISILDSYIAQIVDFGTAYAYLHRYWNDIRTMNKKLLTQEAEDREMRRNVLADGRITTWDVPLRRDRVDVMTPMNGYERPVPMPEDTNLDLIRIEMLNARSNYMLHMAEYAWLDVLCLRKEGGKNEHLRLDKWKLDVPTIGSVYELGLRTVAV
ncbi:hypothetical protein IW262DRAFT_1291236 [Armillaria fumosa]|nr:hypothetical protein IW262DRAFT_1291236 [Armillaria fumosa]